MVECVEARKIFNQYILKNEKKEKFTASWIIIESHMVNRSTRINERNVILNEMFDK